MTPQQVLAGRRALVTGGTRGIGAAIAVAFAAQGARVAIHGREDPGSQRFADEHGFSFISGDFAEESQVDRVADSALAVLGGLDILVNNAGMEQLSTVGRLNRSAVRRQLAVNLDAPILLTDRLVPALRNGINPSVINITSIHSAVPAWGNAVYGAAKAGLEQFTRTLAVELGPAGVRVNAVAPGAIETEMNVEILDEIGRDQFAGWIPLGRVGNVDEIAEPVVFLASAAARYITGATLTVDGGYSHHLVRYRMAGVS